MMLRALAGLGVVVALAACGARDGGFLFDDTAAGGGSGGGGGSAPIPPAHAERVDLLLMVDNSGFMSLKQTMLANTVPDLVGVFTNPPCARGDGVWQPANGGACPAGTSRIFPPVTDLHVGVVTSSLGGHGSDSCTADIEKTENDRGHFIVRTGIGDAPTYLGLGFLAWDPLAKQQPPGESDAGNFANKLGNIVFGAGEKGCGFEASNEAWHRFLADPDPYQTISVTNNIATLSGTDMVLLNQRVKFLRPDSLLVVLVLSDENDCSIRDGSQYFFAGQRYQPGTNKPYHLPKPRPACAKDPNDTCCRSCGQPPAAGCGEDPSCDANNDGKADNVAPEDDSINLRCWDEKRRFGIDFLYPTSRYSDALTQPTVADRSGNLAPNPIFSDLDLTDKITAVRDARLVLYGAIVGVPWQDVGRIGQNGAPNLASGRDAQGRPVGGFMTGAELIANGRYQVILGDPAHYHTNPAALPSDPLMVESIVPRGGKNPITGDQMAAPQQFPNANPINGHEWNILNKDSLEYTCAFDRPTPIQCSTGNCDCEPGGHNPLCQTPMGEEDKAQYRDRAFPGLRHLEIAKTLGDRATVASICPLDPMTAYRPLVRTLGETAAPLLK